MASTQKARRLILTTAVVSITIAGTLYGAGIKTDREVTQVWPQDATDISPPVSIG